MVIFLKASQQLRDDVQCGASEMENIEFGRPSRFAVDENFASEERDWISDLQCLWTNATKKSIQTIAEYVNQCFSYVENPYDIALYLTEKMPDYNAGKASTLSTTVMKAFENWISHHRRRYAEYLTEEIKRVSQIMLFAHLHSI